MGGFEVLEQLELSLLRAGLGAAGVGK